MQTLLASGPAGASRDLTFSQDRHRPLFYVARLKYAVDAPRLEGLDSGFAITRRYEPTEAGAKGATGPAATSYKAGDLVRVTLTFDLTKERRYVAVADPLPAGFEPVESWFATTARDLAGQNDDQSEPSRLVAALGEGRLRPRREARRPGAPVRDAPQRRPSRVLLHRPRHHRRHLLGGAGARGGDVRAGGVRSDRDGGDRREEVKTLLARAAGGVAPDVRAASPPGIGAGGTVARCGGAAVGVAVAALGAAAWIRLGPLPAGLLDEADAVRSTTVLDRNGEVLYEARSDLGTREMRLRADRLPPALVAATLAAEDHRFHSHWGSIRSRWRGRRGATSPRSIASKAARRSRSRWRSCCSIDARSSPPARRGGAGGDRRSRRRSSRCGSSIGCPRRRSSRCI